MNYEFFTICHSDDHRVEESEYIHVYAIEILRRFAPLDDKL